MRKWLLTTTVAVVLLAGCSHQPASLLDQANQSFGLGQFGKAIELCDQIVAAEPGNHQAMLLRGRAHFERGDTTNAIEDYTRVIEANPGDPEAYYFRAKAYQQNGQDDLAAKDKASARERDVRAQLAYTVKPRAAMPKLDLPVDRIRNSAAAADTTDEDSESPLAVDQPVDPLSGLPSPVWPNGDPLPPRENSTIFPGPSNQQLGPGSAGSRVDFAAAVPPMPNDNMNVPPAFDPGEAGVFDRWLSDQRKVPGGLVADGGNQSQENPTEPDAEQPKPAPPRTDPRGWFNVPSGGAFASPTQAFGGVPRTGYPYYTHQPSSSAFGATSPFTPQVSNWPVSPQFPNQQTVSSYPPRQLPPFGSVSTGGQANGQRPAPGQPASDGSSTVSGVWQYQVPFPLPNAATTGVLPDFMD